MKARYVLEVGSLGIDRETSPWSCWDTVVAEGSTWDELLADATVWACDQDGGEAGCAQLSDLHGRVYNQIEAALKRAYLAEGES